MGNKNLDIWEDVFKNNEWGKYPSVVVIKFIAKNFYKVKDRKDIKILEIGSGTGANLWFCAREGFSVYAIDGSKTAVERMQTRFKEEGLDSNVVSAKVGDYFDKLDTYEDDYFDAVIDYESLYCNPFSKTHEIIKKVFSKLKKDGRMLSVTFGEGTFGIDGEEIDHHAVIPTNGPMAGKGFTRYTTQEDIKKLYKLSNNSISNIERQEQHFSNGEVIKEWIIELQKI